MKYQFERHDINRSSFLYDIAAPVRQIGRNREYGIERKLIIDHLDKDTDRMKYGYRLTKRQTKRQFDKHLLRDRQNRL